MGLFKKKQKLGPPPMRITPEQQKKLDELKKKKAKEKNDDLAWIDEIEEIDAMLDDM